MECKIKRIVLFIIVTFAFSFLTVKADTVVLGYGQTYTISSSVYKQLTCDANSEKGYFSTTRTNSGDYIVGSNIVAINKEDDDTLKCKYVLSGVERDLIFTFRISVESYGSGSISVDSKDNKIKLIDFIDDGTITKIEVDNASRFKLCKNGTAVKDCVIEALYNEPVTETEVHTLKISYKNNGKDLTYSIVVYFLPSGKFYANGGGYGTCNWSDYGWTPDTRETNYYTNILVDNKITLPTCDNSKSFYPLLAFKNWVVLTDSEINTINFSIVDKCASGKYKAINGGTAYTPESGESQFWACYVKRAGAILRTDGGTISDDKWTYHATSGTYYLVGESITLPKIDNLPENKVFEGWKSLADGKIYKAGTSLSINSETYFSAVYSSEGDYVSSTSLYVGEKKYFNIYGWEIESCKSSNPSYAKVSLADGACIIEGLKANESGDPEVKVFANVKGKENQYINNLTIHSRTNQTEVDSNGYIIGAGPNTEYTEVSSSVETGAETCNYYNVIQVARLPMSKTGGYHIPLFKAVSTCDSTTYLALCLDPGLPGPGTGAYRKYVKDNSLLYNSSGKLTKFGKGMYALFERFYETGNTENNAEKMAANIAARVWAIKAGAGGPSSPYYSNYMFYANINYNNISISGNKVSPQEYYKTADDCGSGKSTCNYNMSSEDLKIVKTKDGSKSKIEWLTNGFVYTEVGTIAMPSGTVLTGSNKPTLTDDGSCSKNNVSCSVKTFDCGTTDGKVVCNYEIAVTSNNLATAKLSKLKFKLKYESSSSDANMLLVNPVNGNLQRMVLFRTGLVESTISIIPSGKCSAELISKYSALNPNCTSESDCKEKGFNFDLFKSLGCCSYVTDTDSYVYNMACTGGGCVYSTFTPVCREKTSSTGSDYYVIKEGYINKSVNYSCVVNVESLSETDQKTDAAGNSISVDAYKNNNFCRVSCKEDWTISTPNFESFINSSAVPAGGYFKIDKEIFVGGTKTCVTTYLDTNGYISKLKANATETQNAKDKYEKYTNLLSQLNTVKNKIVSKDSSVYSEKSYVVHESNSHFDRQTTTTTETCKTKEDCKNEYCTGLSGANLSGCNRACDLGYTSKKCTYSNTGNVGYSDLYYYEKCPVYSVTFNGTTYSTGYSQGSLSNSCPSFANKYHEGVVGTCETRNADGTTLSSTEVAEKLLNVISIEINNKISEAEYEMAEAASEMDAIQDEFEQCQNFELKLTEDIFTGEKYNNSSSKVVIPASFDPKILYKYEEADYMSLIGSNNKMIPDVEYNDSIFGSSYKDANDKCVSLKDDSGNVIKDSSGEVIQLCRNKKSVIRYSTNVKDSSVYNSNVNTASGSKKSVTLKVCDISSGNVSCSNKVYTYYDVNYIKQSLSNSSFFVNYGSWFVNTASDIKSHGLNKAEAISKVNGIDDGSWSLYAARYNVFPVSLKTRRNWYQYVYSFANIGTYSDGTLGRIMGGKVDSTNNTVSNKENTIIPLNSHTCFYEVYEGACKCCGDPINSYTKDSGENFVITLDISDIPKNKDIRSPGGTLGFYTSSISLDDLSAGDNRLLAANWKAGTPYIIENDIVNSNQGSNLLEYIEKNGEGIYDKVPEYSYTLSPSAISEIRSYNDKNGYEVNSIRLVKYEAVKFKSKNSEWKVTDENAQIQFIHYGSMFLEDTINKYVTEKYKTQTLDSYSNVCATLEADNPISKINGDKCRWVDYIVSKNGNNYRLAFK